VIAAAKLGDKFISNPSFLPGVSQAIANPQNEYQQARSLAVLANKNPNKSLWDLQIMQEKGLSQSGYMSGILEMINKRYGKGDMAELALYQTLKGGGANVSRQDVRTMYQTYLKDPNMWDKSAKGTEKQIEQFETDTRTKAVSMTSIKAKDIAGITEGYTKGAIEGLINQISQTGGKFKEDVGFEPEFNSFNYGFDGKVHRCTNLGQELTLEDWNDMVFGEQFEKGEEVLVRDKNYDKTATWVTAIFVSEFEGKFVAKWEDGIDCWDECKKKPSELDIKIEELKKLAEEKGVKLTVICE